METDLTSNKERYRELCSNNSGIPIFLHHSWYDALFDSRDWNVILAEKNGEIIAFLPYVIYKKYGFKRILPPYLTP